jgi:tetratricopeptide (TPR) repeat protein
MRDIRASAIKGMSIIALIVFLSPFAIAQAGRGDLFMSGFVRNEDASPKAGARVLIVFEQRVDIKRETTTDEQGMWTIRFLKKGKWIATAFSKERMSEMTDVFLNANRRDVELTLTRTTADILVEAKTAIYNEDYKKAIEILPWFISYFPESRELESALFWTSHTYDRLGRAEEDRREAINLETKALPFLERLITEFPESEWADDAAILRIDIALRLYQWGQRQYAQFIEKGITIHDRLKIDVRLAALDAMLRIDQKRAIGILSEIALDDPDPGVRKKVVLILGQSGEKDAAALLENIAEKDPESTVRKAAAIWLKKY